jgi:cytochrome c556
MNDSHNQTKGRGLALRLLPVGICLLLAACTLSPRQKYEQRLADTGAPALHAVRSDRLSDVMRELNSLTSEQMRLPQEMDGTAARQQQAGEVAKVATKLAGDAALLGDMLDGTKIPEQDRPAFMGFAQKLRTEALALKTAAEDDDLHAMNTQLDAVITTCNACHSAFRGLPPVDVQR